MIALISVMLLASGPGVRAPSPALGAGLAYRESTGPQRRRVKSLPRTTPEYVPDVVTWTRIQRRCDRATGGKCVTGPPDMVARHVRK